MTKEELKERTQVFALRIMRLVDAIPGTKSGNVVAKQIARSGTSVGANYRAACRAKSDRDFLNKLVIIEEEADETEYWLGLLRDSGMIQADLILPLLQEAHQLTAIFTASGKTVRDRLKFSDRSSGGRVSEHEIDYQSSYIPADPSDPDTEDATPHNPKSEILNPKSPEITE